MGWRVFNIVQWYSWGLRTAWGREVGLIDGVIAAASCGMLWVSAGFQLGGIIQAGSPALCLVPRPGM